MHVKTIMEDYVLLLQLELVRKVLTGSELVDAGVDAVVIDTAHAHSKLVAETLTEIKKKFKNIDCVVGNIATLAARLIKNNADGVKIELVLALYVQLELFQALEFPSYLLSVIFLNQK